MDAVKTHSHLLRSRYARGWRWLPTGLFGLVLPIAGCVVFAASAVAAALTGLFVGRLQASLAATARSYQFSDTGNVGLVFVAPQPTTVTLVRFVGRLPGFHVVFINTKQATTLQSQDGDPEQVAVLYDTDVEIDFSTSPPTLTGSARPRDGGDSLSLDELYPDITDLRAEVSGPNAAGAWRATLTLNARGASGDEIEYTLDFQVLPSAGQSRLEGSADVQRTYTPVEGEPETITGDGSLAARRMPESALDDVINDNADDEPEPDDNANDNGAPNANDNDTIDNQNDNFDAGPPSACIPGLSAVAAGAVDLFISSGGQDALDTNGNGTVTVSEVQGAINPVLEPFNVMVSYTSAACIAELVNGP